MSGDIRPVVRRFIETSFILGDEAPISDSDSLLQRQILDSTGFLELVTFIEVTFGVKVGDDEMVPENLETLDSIDQFVRRKLGA